MEKKISIHAPAKGATGNKVYTTDVVVEISIHAPAKGATICFLRILDMLPISIHAPAKGATEHLSRDVRQHRISIHAPAKGATGMEVEEISKKTFQSTLPRRERRTNNFLI